MLRAGKDAKSLFEQGLIYEQQGNLVDAFEAFRLSAKAASDTAAPLVGLARILRHNQQPQEAIACLQRAVVCEPKNVPVHIELGHALLSASRLNEAEKCFRFALQFESCATEALFGLGAVHEDQGRRTDAESAFRELIEREPKNAKGIARLLTVVSADHQDSVIHDASKLMLKAPDEDKATIGYALGKAYDKNKEYEKAFSAWSDANKARQRSAGKFDRVQFDTRLDNLTKLFSKEFFASRRDWGDSSDSSVFVVGLLRSGTTLTERIVSAHPSAFGAGELPDLTDLATGIPERLGRENPPWPMAAAELTASHAKAIGEEYTTRLAAKVPDLKGPNVMRVLDKQPLNFWHLGLVAMARPRARILNCTRDIRDNGLSIYAEDFSVEQRWSTDLSDIKYYWQGYKRLIEHWQDVCNLDFFEVCYEATVSELHKQAEDILNFLDLPWDSSVLTFHNRVEPVQTPSRWQVRKPLYSSSAGRWHNYAPHISELTNTSN